MRLSRICCLAAALLTLCFVASAAPAIYLHPNATPLERSAAVELQRYMFVAFERVFTIELVANVPDDAVGLVLGTPDAFPQTETPWPFGLEPPRDDGYLLHSLRDDNRLVAIAAPTPNGVQNGVYGYLEELGFGFYLSGDTRPDHSLKPKPYHESVSPAFAVRGFLPRFGYFCSASTWEFEDYASYIDQMVRMRCNLVAFLARDTDPFAAYSWDGGRVGGEPLANTADAVNESQPLPTSQFFAGTGRYFSGEYFGASASFIEDRDTSVRAAKAVLQRAITYAKSRGMKVCLGFEVGGDALDADTQARFEARLRSVLESYPAVDFIALWEPEVQALLPHSEPAPRSLWESQARRFADAFSDVPGFARQAEAVRWALFAMRAQRILEAVRPDVGLVLSGWGGDRWLRCTDFFPGMDQVLDENVTFAALDSVRLAPEVAESYGQTAPDRPRWPILWMECDGDLWMPQPNLASAAEACRDVLEKGCQGLLGMHWRTREVDETAAFLARFAWNPELTPEDFCNRRSRDLFGQGLGDTLAPILMRLQNLGYRWVGGWGQTESSPFAWRPGREQNHAELAGIASELRAILQELGVLRGFAESLPGLVPQVVPELASDALPELVPNLAGEITGAILPSKIASEKRAALMNLLAQIDYVLAYDRAAAALTAGDGLDELVAAGSTNEALRRIQDSPLGPAALTYFSGMRTKDELGMLATLNTKGWANIRARTGLDDATLSPLEVIPGTWPDVPRLNLLPDRLIVTGLPAEKISVSLKARRLGARRFDEVELRRVSRSTFDLGFPKDLDGVENVEYGIVVRSAFRRRLVWPEGFPVRTVTRTRSALVVPDLPHPRAAAEVKPVEPSVAVVPARYALQLTWDARPGEVYTVSRDGAELGTVSDGWFEDTAPPSGATVEYAVKARNLLSNHTAARYLRTTIPELPLPKAPETQKLGVRGGRVILGWDSDSPVADRYLVTRVDQERHVIGHRLVQADYGHLLAATDRVAGGEIAQYRIAGVTPDGRTGPSTRTLGVIGAAAPVKPLVHLSFNDDAFLEGLADLTEQALALGGRGWAELPSQPNWNPKDALTINVWVKLDDLNGMPVLVCKGAWLQAGYFLQIFNEQVRFHVAGVDTFDAGRPVPGEWQMLTGVYGAGEMRIYINGDLAGRRKVAGSPTPSQSPLLLGRYGLGDDAYFVHGLLDEVAIYDVALTRDELAAYYHQALADRQSEESTPMISDRSQTYVVAHRGASAYAPENTLAAYKLAVDMGADWFELDCALSKDGEVIVIHDDKVDRTTDGSGMVAALTLAELKQFDAGSWKSPEFADQRIPTLAEALDFAKGTIGVYVEIKSAGNDGALEADLLAFADAYVTLPPHMTRDLIKRVEADGTPNLELTRKAVALIRERGMESEVVVQSFSPIVCAVAALEAPELRVELLTGAGLDEPDSWEWAVRWAYLLDLAGINVESGGVDPARLGMLHASGKTMAVWTVDDPATMRRLTELGVDGIITNRPDAYAASLRAQDGAP